MLDNSAATRVSGGIEVSQNDKRDYRQLVLANGLRVVLISDVEADSAAAALSVAVGSHHDPDAIPGLAHFLEHMLFLGTEQFPSENEYSSFLSEHGGSSNAYTASDQTVRKAVYPPDQTIASALSPGSTLMSVAAMRPFIHPCRTITLRLHRTHWQPR